MALDKSVGISPIDIWISLHVEIESWHLRTEAEGDTVLLREKSIAVFLNELREFPAEKWNMIGQGAGWTPVSAMALSWCKGAHWKGVLEAWSVIPELNLDSPVTQLSAQMINPKFLPEPVLADILKVGETLGGAWVLMTALKAHDETTVFQSKQCELKLLHPALQKMCR